MKVNAVGHIGSSGLGRAFEMHAGCLSTFHDVSYESINGGPRGQAENLYFHGMPKDSKGFNSSGRSIAYWVCESTELDESYHQEHDRFTDIWTASTFCQEVMERELNRKVKLVPHYVDKFSAKTTSNTRPTILIAFDGHSRILRKNPAASVAAARDAFGANCEIIVKAKHLKPSYKQWLVKTAKDSPISFIEEHLDDEEMTQLYDRVDILLSLHCAEGFGLHILEAMAHSKKVVATDFGGSRDFLLPATGYPVEDVINSTTDEVFKGKWAFPSHDHAVEQLRIAATDDGTKNKAAFKMARNNFNHISTLCATEAAL